MVRRESETERWHCKKDSTGHSLLDLKMEEEVTSQRMGASSGSWEKQRSGSFPEPSESN